MNLKKLNLMLIAAGMMLVTGCGKSADNTNAANNTANTNENTVTEGSTDTEESEDATVESATQYPITIQHALGETVIESKPENIVTIAWGNQDVPLALGVVPTGVSMANFGAVDENGLLPWTTAQFEALGVDAPNVFNDTDGLDYEAISDANPDVILAAYSGISQEEYDMLSAIAPVIAYPQAPWQTYWREETIFNATAMGMESEGEALVTETEELIASKLAQYPDIAGKKAAFCWISAADLGTFYIYLPTDPRANFLLDLGLELPDSVNALIEDNSSFAVTVSAELAEQLSDIDIIITYGDASLLEAIQADALLSAIPAVKNGAVVLLDSSSTLAAACNPTVLSIPATIDEYLTMLNDAAQKVQ